MKPDKSMLLLLLQFLILLALPLISYLAGGGSHVMLQGMLYGALVVIAASLFMQRYRFNAKLKRVVADLERVRMGNMNTRLLANDGSMFDEVIFSINALIEQLSRMQIQSIRSEAARKSLLSNISHDIRTPLTSIIGYVDALKDDIAGSHEEKQEYMAIISSKASALKALIEELFQLAKLDGDDIPMQPEPLDLAEIARESVIAFLPELKQAGIRLQANIPEEKCMIMADHLSLLRIMNNMIKNAVQYGSAGQVLGVELIERANAYHLSVWDKGAGIASADLAHVFDRMYRADRSRNAQNFGSGLGLAIAKALVEKNEGTIWVESIPGVKTTFTFSIPKESGLRIN
ncbi:HAMP domain-containing histidine kinase [Paenibacillus oenotherae]|uniref:histidine kinase n=1 Tax=Paenibacillus oenotherae TaxID=1435645 RepID=A0ABS7D6J3_9BACL|nr:HAMP domain-containing sensor histidine kinase [Paenibacillus oenotherae]MBW7475408.1 HAMP domain-containing histidine kinase [Paenibacillus oenotherae]